MYGCSWEYDRGIPKDKLGVNRRVTRLNRVRNSKSDEIRRYSRTNHIPVSVTLLMVSPRTAPSIPA